MTVNTHENRNSTPAQIFAVRSKVWPFFFRKTSCPARIAQKSSVVSTPEAWYIASRTTPMPAANAPTARSRSALV